MGQVRASTPTADEAPRRRARRGDGGRLREEILRAATDLLLRTGDESAVSVRAVAGEVGVTPPSIYLHFADKNELLFECCSTLLDELTGTVLHATGEHADPQDRLRAAAHQLVAFGLENPEPYRILFMSPHHQVPGDFDLDTYGGTRAFRALVALVAEAMGSPVTDDIHVRGSREAVAAMGMLVAVHGVIAMMVAKAVEPIDFPWPPVDDLVDHIMDVHLAALRRDG